MARSRRRPQVRRSRGVLEHSRLRDRAQTQSSAAADHAPQTHRRQESHRSASRSVALAGRGAGRRAPGTARGRLELRVGEPAEQAAQNAAVGIGGDRQVNLVEVDDEPEQVRCRGPSTRSRTLHTAAAWLVWACTPTVKRSGRITPVRRIAVLRCDTAATRAALAFAPASEQKSEPARRRAAVR